MAGPALKDEVMARLDEVRVPDGSRSIVEAGLVSDVFVSDGRVAFAINVAPEEAKAYAPVRTAAEAAVKAVPGVERAMVALTAERPSGGRRERPAPAGPTRTRPGEAAAPPPAEGGRLVPEVRHILAIASGKGGVGKSTTAVNIATALSALGWSVGVLDADIYGPSIPTLLRLRAKPESLPDRRLAPLDAYGLKAISIGLLVPADAPVVWRGPMVTSALTQLLRDVAWGALDCLVIDMPPGTGDVQISLAQQVPLSGAVIVTTPQDLALIDARKATGMFGKVNVPVLGIVENMSHFICPNCGYRSEIFTTGGGRKEAERLSLPFLGEVPLDIKIREQSDAGAPVVVADGESPQAVCYLDIAARLMGMLEENAAGRRPPPRIVIEDEAEAAG